MAWDSSNHQGSVTAFNSRYRTRLAHAKFTPEKYANFGKALIMYLNAINKLIINILVFKNYDNFIIAYFYFRVLL